MRFAGFAIAFAALLVAPACGKSTCEKYADMEVKCGNYDDPAAQEMAAHFKAEAECAKKTTDCAEYKACTDGVR
jgi:hypothetical protein